MESVRLGIIGIGAMGSIHAQSIMEGKVPRCELSAVCDPKPERMKRFSSAEAFHSAPPGHGPETNPRPSLAAVVGPCPTSFRFTGHELKRH